ncbi:unnamed protein product [Rotaria sp. Silwood1]|nr:unnamed protein product [Rotaria sp. Silwood1]CAF4640113.1 unnamed protein product [Rotaria sp. Silwood1]
MSKMQSKENQIRTPTSTQQQDNRFNQQNSQKSIVRQEDRSSDEDFDLLKYLKENQEKLMDKYGYGKSSKRRCPRYYFINENKSILIILQGDITKTKVDAIVNAANEHMTGGGGVDGIIHRAAGSELYTACRAHKQLYHGVRLPTGHSRILLSYNMSSTTYYIINTAGPIYNRYRAKECADELLSCYKTALALANLYDLESIGFTAISCGIFGYPANQGAEIALQTVNKEAGIVPVIVFVLWDDDIYDAWVRKVEELQFTPFDIEKIETVNLLKSSTANDETQTKTKTSSNDDEPQSPTKFNPAVRDFSTQDTKEKTPEDDVTTLLNRLPSVPHDMSDTQQTDLMEQDDNATNEAHPLETQQTQVMTSMNSDQEQTTTNNDSEQKSMEETTGEHHDEQNRTNNDQTQPATIQKDTDNPHAETAKTEAVEGDKHHSSMTDNSQN